MVAIVVGFAISFALALAIRRRRWLAGPILAAGGILYAIPSLALFAFLVPFTGIQNPLTAEIALVSYTILILVRNIVAGLDGVPAEVLEAADRHGLHDCAAPVARRAAARACRSSWPACASRRSPSSASSRSPRSSASAGWGISSSTSGTAASFLTATVVGAVGAVLLALLADRGFVWIQRR